MKKLEYSLFKPVDNSFLVVFRVIFGFLITAEAWGAILTGWVERTFITPSFTFSFIDFPWLQPLPGNGMYFYFFIMGCFGVMVMLGFKYRLAISAYSLMWAAVYFMQKSNYNNHYYLLVLLCLIMCLVPANRSYSLDAKHSPEFRSFTCPNWCRLIFIVQIGIVYTYGGIAKLNPDWLSTESVAIILRSKADLWMVGSFLQENWAHWIIAIGGAFFDLFITPLLLWKRTRKFAFGLSVFFHLFNSAVFQVGIFPFMGIGMCIFFFPPDTIRRLFFKNRLPVADASFYLVNKKLIALLSLWVLLQVSLPLRHWIFPGDVNWTEEGHRLSWRMMLRSKSGYVNFKVVNPVNDSTFIVDQSLHLTRDQQRNVATKPDICWQYVQYLKEEYAKEGLTEVEIYAEGKVGLNGKKRTALYNPNVNLAAVEWQPFKSAEWLLHLESDL
ncbi:HTTM domain-containing protein [Marivirga lumbricoides]